MKSEELETIIAEVEENHRQESDNHEIGDEIWLISYSDLMTLLFGFFVLMYALSKTTTQQQQSSKEAIAKTFAGSYSTQDEVLAKELKKLAQKAKENEALGQIEVTQPKDGLEITFRSNLLFGSGSADLNPEMQATMKILVEIISKNVNKAEIMVAGHTDNNPIHSVKFPSNWELSAARAATVVKEFERNGYVPHLLVAMGYGSSRPTLPNQDENRKAIPTNQEKNRRVVIKVVSPNVVKQPTPTNNINNEPTTPPPLNETLPIEVKK
jgi:chemotaxis protein MotB